MKQIIQSVKTKKTELIDVPVPLLEPGYLLVQTTRSLVSTGTEKMAVEFETPNITRNSCGEPFQI